MTTINVLCNIGILWVASKVVTQQLTLLIKTLRLQQKLSQQKLADMAGIPRSTLTAIEGHWTTPRQKDLARIAAALGVTIDGLYKK
jgi:XRE family transcriptional regulator, regulator of sulfur utilization